MNFCFSSFVYCYQLLASIYMFLICALVNTYNIKIVFLQTPIAQSKSEIEAVEGELILPQASSSKDKEPTKTSCIVCKKPARASSIYCSNTCIWKHAQDSLGNQNPPCKDEGDPGKSTDKQKAESRVSLTTFLYIYCVPNVNKIYETEIIFIEILHYMFIIK